MPSRAAVQKWLARGSLEPEKHPDLARFVDQYAHAREAQAELIMDDMLEIADDSRNDYEMVEDGDGNFVPKFNPDNIRRAKLRIDARKWMLARMYPKKYGRRS